MELFAAAGIDLPSSGAGARRARPAIPSLHAPLFNPRVVEDDVKVDPRFEPDLDQLAKAAAYARKVRDPKFLKQKELAVRGRLIEEVLQGVLGYRPFDPTAPFSLSIEQSIRAGSVDVALGRFNDPDGRDLVVAPFELKGPGYVDLERVDPGRGRSPVQQAWDYAVDSPGARWVLVSNCIEVRLYAFGRGRDAYEVFDLSRLDERAVHERLWRLVGADNLLGGRADRLLRETDSAYRQVTNELYAQYSALRVRLIDWLRSTEAVPADPEAEDAPVIPAPALPRLKAVEVAQKLLDRVLFIAFAQRTDLMQDRLLEKAAETVNAFAPQPLWTNFKGLFRAVDVGNQARMDIPAYNGGLFARDPVADAVMLPDHLAVDLARLGEWDYRREVPVTVLGRLFEKSVDELEALRSGPAAAPAKAGPKRKDVVYTPDQITRFLVSLTLAVSLDERRAALWAAHGMGADPAAEAQVAFWRAWLESLGAFTVVDPACGSGAFLVAAFDELARRYREAASALDGLGEAVGFDVYDRILNRNLYGVDLNAESVEITRLSLWLKTARRGHKLQGLDRTIRDGDSLIEDAAFTPRPFDWRAAFPEVFEAGGFDVVIGNPPYVRMEVLKPVKPYLAKHYAVADERTDLYAYFFERGAEVLKPGGRLGFISSSTFFKTGSGQNLRTRLTDGLAVEAVLDFGDVQVFEGVTTYAAILTLRKADAPEGSLTYLNVRGEQPGDLGRAFAGEGRPMPRARLGRGSWRFEDDALAALRAKIADGRPTLREVYGAPLYGIKTGLNEAFVIDRATRDRLVEADPRSAELLKPFLRGEDIKRWRVEPADLFLINTPRGAVDIDAYPAVRAWLLPFKERLEARATKQAWWELQQAQAAYQPKLDAPKLVWPHFQEQASFTLDDSRAFLNNKCFFLPSDDETLVGLLNAKSLWFQLRTISRAKRGGYIEAEAQYVEQLHLPMLSAEDRLALADRAALCGSAARELALVEAAVAHRILDLAPAGRTRLPRKLQAWPTLTFKQFLAEAKAAFGAEPTLKARAEWEAYLAEHAAEVRRLTAAIEAAEREIDATVYRLFDLTDAESALLEASLEGQY